jgi:hypothetical protein
MAELVRLDGRAPASPKVLYLLGRALEADGEPAKAREQYLTAIGTATWLANDAPLELLRYLARRRAVGRSIGPTSPGVEPSWRRLVKSHFVLFHELAGSAAGLARRVEDDRARSLARLGLADPARLASKPVVFVFRDEQRYHSSGNAARGWAAGHATHDELEDGGASTMVVYEFADDDFNVDDVIGHEWTHILVDEHLAGARLPSWAVEGVATWTERDSVRARRLASLAGYDWPIESIGYFLRRWVDWRYVGASASAAETFYSESLAAFDTVARRNGSAAAALAAAREVRTNGKTPFEVLGFKDGADFKAELPFTGRGRVK